MNKGELVDAVAAITIRNSQFAIRNSQFAVKNN
jgi:hypothetical protein